MISTVQLSILKILNNDSTVKLPILKTMISTIKLLILERAYRKKNELDMNDKYSENLNTGAKHSNNGNIRLTKIVQLQLKHVFE